MTTPVAPRTVAIDSSTGKVLASANQSVVFSVPGDVKYGSIESVSDQQAAQ